MNKTIRLLFASLIFFVGFSIGAVIKLNYEKHTFKQYEWVDAPVILNCYGGDMSETTIIRAINYWTIRDHPIDGYINNPPSVLCESKLPMIGFIILRKANPQELSLETLAYTERFTLGNRMESATIYFREGTQNMDLLSEHEIGHALGYAHADTQGHIMYPIYDDMGDAFWIP